MALEIPRLQPFLPVTNRYLVSSRKEARLFCLGFLLYISRNLKIGRREIWKQLKLEEWTVNRNKNDHT